MFKEQEFIAKELKKILISKDFTPLFIHTGTYNYQTVNASLITLRQYVESHFEKKQIIRRIYSILVEGVENIYKHGFAFENSGKFNSIYGYVILGQEAERFSIWTGNFIKNNEIETLKQLLNNIIISDSENLQGDYNYILNNSELSEKQGMGIGIIDIALRSKEPINYKTISYDKDISFFCLEITIKK